MNRFYFLLLFVIGSMQYTNAQTASQYYFKHKAGITLENMDGAESLFGTQADGVISGAIQFFPFTFAGTTYSSFSVSEDGLVVLGNAAYTSYPYDNYFTQTPALSGQTAVYPILLAWGEDLYTTTDGAVRYKIVGTQPSRKLVIEYKVSSAEDNAANFNKTFQVWLSEGLNQIQYVYGNCAADWWNSANIGIASSATSFVSVDGATNTVSNTKVYSNEGQFFDKATVPVEGTAYIFSPTEIVDAAPLPPASPVTAALSMQPEFPVAGQQRHTIYLGYGAQSVTLAAAVSGGNPPAAGYTYSWSPATGLSSTSTATPVASPLTSTPYTVTITDGNGNSTTQTITVYVMDPRFGDKFKVCKNGKTTICISKEAVDVQLQGGATLGECTAVASVNQISASAFSMEARITGAASSGLTVYPNPSAGVIQVSLPAAAHQRTIQVLDAGGMVTAQKTVNEKEQTIQFDLTNKARGIYMVRSISNGRVQTSKLIIR